MKPMPDELGPRIEDQEEMLHRQVHPTHVETDGRIQSIAFKPKQSDEGHLSVHQHSVANAAEAYGRHTGRGRQSAGTWSILVGECSGLELPAHEQRLEDDDAHAAVDFNAHGKKQVADLSKKLRDRANARGCQYEPAAAAVTEARAMPPEEGEIAPPPRPALPETGRI